MNPMEVQLHAAYIILDYLKGSPGKGILLKRSDKLVLEAYIDADYVG